MEYQKICKGCKIKFKHTDKRQKYCNQRCYFNNLSVWNKGLTKETDTRILKYSRTLKENYKKNPKIKCGFKKGHKTWSEGLTKETDERVEKISNIKKRKSWKDVFGLEKSIKLKKRMSERVKGEKHPLFNNWSSFEPYGIEFDERLKKEIRKRDNHTCQECFKKKQVKLDIHHIDYNKNNNHPLNLISLCRSCHAKTNYNKEHWKRYFQNIIVLKEIFNPENMLIFNEKTKGLIGIKRP